MATKTVTDQSFASDVLGSESPVLVDFWAEWCGPCRMMAPEFERAAAAIEPRARLVKVNVDAEPALAQRFQVRSIPTLVLALHGGEVARTAGARSAAQLAQWVEAELSRVNVAPG
jgi:thioredoxin